jgi:MSHA pilin protein MshC
VAVRLRQCCVSHAARPESDGLRLVCSQSGFSVVELVLVIVILGVLASVAGPRFFGNNEFSERAYRDELAITLRYAQKVAVATGCPVRASITAAGYALNQQAELNGHCDPADSSFTSPVLLAGGQATAGSTPPGVAVAPAVVFRFDALGRTDLAGDQLITVGGQTLNILADSGLVMTP